MGEVLSPRDSGHYIASKSKFVTIHDEGIQKLAQKIVSSFKQGEITIAAYGDDGLHPTLKEKSLVDWMFLIDVLNFCFWTPPNCPKWTVEGQTGYLALCAAISRAVKKGIDITNPKYYAVITEEELSTIFRADDNVTKVPLHQKRVECLNEVGNRLCEKYDGSFSNCIKEANKSAVSLVKIIVDNFPCFRDVADFDGKRLSLYKRAQIAVADLWSRFLGQGLGEFHDIDDITMFADYRVPQVLVHYGAMQYTPELMAVLKQDKILTSGCREEIEIRGCSIHAVELVTAAARELIKSEGCNPEGKPMNSVLVDFFLWLYRREHAAELEYIPFHKVLGHFY